MVSLLQALRRAFVTTPRRRYIYTVVVALIVGFLSWTSVYTRSQDLPVLNALFSSNSYNSTTDPYGGLAMFDQPTRGVALTLFSIMKFALTSLTLSLPIPAGLVMPVMSMGAGFSRLFGEISEYVFAQAFVCADC
jgi:H+/Cl- antiporter ClcA